MSSFSWKNVLFALAMAFIIPVAIAAGTSNVGDLAELEASIQLGQLLALVSALAARLFRRRRRSSKVPHHGGTEVHGRMRIGSGTRSHKRKGTPRRPWLNGLHAWRLRSPSRPCAYEVSFLNEASEWKDHPTSVLYREFTRQFRIPFPLFNELVEMTRNSGMFKDHDIKGVKGPKPHPLPLKILAALRFLATGASFKSLEVESGISEPVLSRFYHNWIKWLVDTHFDKWVSIPKEKEEVEVIQNIYHLLGFPGCVGSMDGVHVAWDCCPQQQIFLYKGKEGYPTLAWNVHCDHLGRIMHINGPHPGGRNDKNMAQLDDMIKAVREDTLFTGSTFNMRSATGELVEHVGAWLLCDGGYHQWLCTICGFKHTSIRERFLWSKRMESVRKDIENTFGILKTRFRVLRLPFMLPNEEDIDNTFRVCCMLHNWLLDHNGYTSIGQAALDWKTPQGDAILDDRFQAILATSRVCARVTDDNGNRAMIDSASDFGRVGPLLIDSQDAVAVEVQKGFAERREALVAHYNYVNQNNEALWLRTVTERETSM